MGKAKTIKSIRDIELHQDAQHILEKILGEAKNTKVATKTEVMEQFYNCFESGDNFAEQLNNRGIEDRRAQIYALTFVSNHLGRKVTKPKYGVVFMPLNLRDAQNTDDAGKRSRTISAFGQALIINLKNDEEHDEKFAMIKSYDKECTKIENLEIGKIVYVEAVATSVSADVVNMTVDDRCGYAKDTDRVLSDVEDLMTSIFDITPIADAINQPSEGKYGDYRLVESLVGYIVFPKEKNYAKMELTDASVSLEELEKKKNQANLTCLINKELVSGVGRDSIVRFLGRISVKDDPEYGLQVTLFFPIMAYPMLLVAPDTPEDAPSEEVADASNYFSKDQEAVKSGDYDEYFDGDKKEESEEETENGKPDEVLAEEESEEPGEDTESAEEPIEETEEIEPEEQEEQIEETPEEVVEEQDPYAAAKDCECVASGDFGDPGGIEKGKKSFNNGCYVCFSKSPEIYELCVRKSKE